MGNSHAATQETTMIARGGIMSSIQLTLFEKKKVEKPSKSDKPVFSQWSYSRRGVLEQCSRKYYYQYYGSNLNTAKNDPQKEKLHFLKKLQNRHLRSGDILHFVISWYLKEFQRGRQPSLNRLLQWARTDFRADIRFSRQYEPEFPLSDNFRDPKLLLEFYYGMPDAESLCAESEERLITALTNFITSQNLTQFREGACKASALIEESARLKANDFTLSGKVDLAYWESDRLVIVDWKIGSTGGSDDSLQMLAYAWWAKQEFECPVDYIIPHRVHLADNTVSTFNVSEKALTRVEARVLQDLERMQEMDNYGKQGIVDAFTPCAQPKICALCQFQEVCPKE